MRGACEVIGEVGVGNTTHRLVAARAGVPLGATTYYFASLDDLVAAALEHASAETLELVRRWMERARDSADLPGVLTALTGEYLADRPRAMVEYELYVAAARSPELRGFARAWVDGVNDFLSVRVGPRAASAAVAILDGTMLHALTLDVPLDREQLRWALARCLEGAGPGSV
ncbi:TetR family transcriptional regulator [Embleya sp. NBC_00896]|uniref:TetR/AcrR family transcriptional regulator n=1 Tax=Embleya sp. NBC_00896 TaxID=2975961 RepID=UPI002F910ADA|nr:TetR family transcriptional regulator [Embleya sp. NBC_00896]